MPEKPDVFVHVTHTNTCVANIFLAVESYPTKKEKAYQLCDPSARVAYLLYLVNVGQEKIHLRRGNKDNELSNRMQINSCPT